MKQQERVAKANIERWKNTQKRDLYDVYKNPSLAKRRAWGYCVNLCYLHGGNDLKVVGFNCMKFSAGFEFVNDKTGELMYMHITPSYDTPVSMS